MALKSDTNAMRCRIHNMWRRHLRNTRGADVRKPQSKRAENVSRAPRAKKNVPLGTLVSGMQALIVALSLCAKTLH